MAVAYRNNFSYIERQVIAIGLQDNLATTLCRLVDVRESPSGKWAFADEIEVRWAKPTTGGGQGRSEVLNNLYIMLGEGRAVQLWSR